MTIREKQPKSEIVIDITGPDGNAFALMGYAKKLAKQHGLDGDSIIKEMMAGDYNNLLLVFINNFSDYAVLER